MSVALLAFLACCGDDETGRKNDGDASDGADVADVESDTSNDVATEVGLDVPDVADIPDTPDAPDTADAPDAEDAADATDTGPAGQAIITVSGGPLDFGDWRCGAAAPDARTLTLKNEGDSDGVWLAELVGANADAFQIAAPAAGRLAPGQSTTIVVRPLAVTPTVTATIGRLDVRALAGGIGGLTVELSTRRTGAYITVQSTPDNDFGEVPVSQTRTLPFNVVNTGGESATFALDASFPSDLEIVGATSGDIVTGTPRTLTVSYTPSGPGRDEGRLDLGLAGPVCAVNLPQLTFSGAAAVGALSVSGDIDFGQTACGAIAPPQPITLTNSGDAPVAFEASLFDGTYYALDSNAGAVPPHGSVVLLVEPAPLPDELADLATTFDDGVTITTDIADDPPHVVAISQRARGAAIALGTDDITLRAAPGESDARTFAVINTGNASSHVEFNGGIEPFSVAPAGGIDLAPGSAGTFTVRYAPSDGSNAVTTLGFASRPDGCTVPLVGPTLHGLAPSGAVEVGSDDITFASNGCDAEPQPYLLALRNPDAEARTYPVALVIDGGVFSVDPSQVVDGSVNLPGRTTTFLEVRADGAAGLAPGDYDGLLVVGEPADSHPIPLHFRRSGAVLAWVEAPIDLGVVPVGEPAGYSVVLRNLGNYAVPVLLSASGGYHAAVEIAARADGKATDTSVSLFTRAAPVGKFGEEVTLDLSDDAIAHLCPAPGAVESIVPQPLAVSAEGVPGVLTLAPASIDFGDFECGGWGVPPWKGPVLTNDGETAVTIEAQLLDGTAFQVRQDFTTIPAHTARTLYVQAMALPPDIIPGQVISDTLIIRTDIPGDEEHVVPVHETVRGAVVRPAKVVTVPRTEIGEASAPIPLGIRIEGNAAIELRIDDSVQDAPGEFSYVRSGGLGARDWNVVFRPRTGGLRNVTAVITAAPGSALCGQIDPPSTTITASAGGGEPLSVVPPLNRIAFEMALCGSDAVELTHFVHNPNASSATFTAELVGGGASPFELVTLSGTVDPNGPAVPFIVRRKAIGQDWLPDAVAASFNWSTVLTDEVVIHSNGLDTVVTLEAPIYGAAYRFARRTVEGLGSPWNVSWKLDSTVDFGLLGLVADYGLQPAAGTTCTVQPVTGGYFGRCAAGQIAVLNVLGPSTGGCSPVGHVYTGN